MNDSAGSGHGSLFSYTVGYLLSLILTIGAYSVVSHANFGHTEKVGLIIGLAVVQLFVQMVFFLHLGRESKARWNLMVFGFMMMVVLILVIGSLWIMRNLNYHSEPQTPAQINNYLNSQDGL